MLPGMELTEFIEQNRERILREWVEFAKGRIPSAKDMSDEELRDHADELLRAVASDMADPQTRGEQHDKSQGLGAGGEVTSVGQRHATQRLATGFDLHQLVSEYRALRASVLRLWADAHGDEHRETTRFNEAIDESLTASVQQYSEDLDRTRELFLGVLGHDLRNPLGAIVSGATLVAQSEGLDARGSRAAKLVVQSAQRMARMIDDLLDVTRARLGQGIPIAPVPTDLAPLCEHVIAELAAVHPQRELRFEATGGLTGEWDGDRLTQVVSNLAANALQHGRPGGPVRIVAEDRGDRVFLSVNNQGEPIPAPARRRIFDPMVRHTNGDADRSGARLGLGLYIAREIVVGHGGTIDVASTAEEGTTFTVELPRRPPAAGGRPAGDRG